MLVQMFLWIQKKELVLDDWCWIQPMRTFHLWLLTNHRTGDRWVKLKLPLKKKGCFERVRMVQISGRCSIYVKLHNETDNYITITLSGVKLHHGRPCKPSIEYHNLFNTYQNKNQITEYLWIIYTSFRYQNIIHDYVKLYEG